MQGYLGTPITRRAGGRLGAPAINTGGLAPRAIEDAREAAEAARLYLRPPGGAGGLGPNIQFLPWLMPATFEVDFGGFGSSISGFQPGVDRAPGCPSCSGAAFAQAAGCTLLGQWGVGHGNDLGCSCLYDCVGRRPDQVCDPFSSSRNPCHPA